MESLFIQLSDDGINLNLKKLTLMTGFEVQDHLIIYGRKKIYISCSLDHVRFMLYIGLYLYLMFRAIFRCMCYDVAK